MSAEFDIFGGFIDEKVLQSFKDLEKQAKRTADSMQEIAKVKDEIFGSFNGKNGVSKTQEKLAADLERANAKMRQIQEQGNVKMKEIEAKHLNEISKEREKFNNKMLEMDRKLEQQRKKTSEAIAKAKKAEEIAFLQAVDKENTAEEIAAQKRLSRDAKIAMQKAETEAKILRAQEAAAEKRQMLIDKEAEKAARLAQKQAEAAAKAANAPTPEQKATASVANSNQANVLKLNAIAADANSTALQKMYAQMKLLEIEMQSKFNPALTEQSAEFRNLNAQHAKLQQEYNRTARATGVMGRSMNSMYGSTFQLTQVMRELPNFAIDARVGFMALSNNLPMLADSFKQLKQQIIDTEGAAGATRKTWAAFGKSLLSLNTIMIVVSTAMILFGDKIIELFTGKLPLAQKATNELVKSIREGNSEFNRSVETFFRLNAIMDSTSKGFISQKDAVEEYNKAFGKTNGYVSTFEQAQERLKNQTPAYVEAMVMMAYANKFLEQAVKDYSEAEALRRDKDVSFFRKVGQFFNPTVLGKGAGKSLEEQVLFMREEEAREKTADFKSNMKMFIDEYAKAAKFMKDNGIDIWGNDKENKKGVKKSKKESEPKMQDGTEMFVAQESFSEERLRLLSVISKAEEGMLKENEDGELRSYRKRINMAESYRNAKESLLNLELKDAKDNITAKNAAEGEALAKTMEENDKLFNEGKMTKERHLELQNQYNEATKTLEQNFQNDIKKLDYEAKKDLEKNELDFRKNQTRIAKDSIEEIQRIQREELDKNLETQKYVYDILVTLADSFYEKMNQQLEKWVDKQNKIEDERYNDINDREKAGVISKEQAEEEKANVKAYYDSVEEEANRKKAEMERESFLLSQAFAVADVWIKFSQAAASYQAAIAAISAATLGVGTAPAIVLYESLTAKALTTALFSTGLIAAQTIPAFEHGGDVTETGLSLVGEKRHELVYNPRTGKAFITPNKPTFMNLERGMHVYPDINKLDLDSFNLSQQAIPTQIHDDRLLDEVKQLNRNFSKQKPQPINGLRLMQQLQFNQKIITNRRGLLN